MNKGFQYTIKSEAEIFLNENITVTQVTGESAEDTLRVLLIESDRIKEMVSEAESRARSWLQAKSQVLCDFS